MQYPTQRFLTADGQEISLIYDPQEDTVWASQKQISLMFSVDVKTINSHTILIEPELGQTSCIRYFRIKATNQKTYNVKHYNSQVIELIKQRLRRSGKALQYEKEIFHSLVEKFLFNKGFTHVRHEAPMSVQGKADFVAYQSDQQHLYVIECKVEQFKTRHVAQAWDYAGSVKSCV